MNATPSSRSVGVGPSQARLAGSVMTPCAASSLSISSGSVIRTPAERLKRSPTSTIAMVSFWFTLEG